MNLKTLYRLAFVSLFTFPIALSAQVGINNNNPDSTSVLDMSGGRNRNKGILLPEADTLVLVKPSHGLLLFNPMDGEFYFRNDSTGSWECLNRLKHKYGTNKSYLIDSLAIGKTTPTTQLDVNGNTSILGELNVTDLGPSDGSQQITPLSSALRNQSIKTNGSINSNEKLRENGADLVPRGTIVMWSGSIIPAGWAPCNGWTYSWNGINTTTPDLRGRFIVGQSNTTNTNYGYFNSEKIKTEYNTIGKTGGAADVKLTAAQIPSHSHSYSGTTTGTGEHSHTYQVHGGGSANGTHMENAGGGTAYQVNQGDAANKIWKGAHTHTYSGTTTAYGGTSTHENTPPYYVLAFIIKL